MSTPWNALANRSAWDVPATLSLRFSPDGNILATAGKGPADGKALFSACEDRIIRLWDTASGKERSQLLGHRGAVNTLAVSPDGTRLASGSRDGTVLVWDLVSLAKGK